MGCRQGRLLRQTFNYSAALSLCRAVAPRVPGARSAATSHEITSRLFPRPPRPFRSRGPRGESAKEREGPALWVGEGEQDKRPRKENKLGRAGRKVYWSPG